MVVKRRCISKHSAVQPASKPTKCGAKITAPLPCCKACTSPTMCKRLATKPGLPCHSQARSNHAWANNTMWAIPMRRCSFAPASGKHKARLVNTTLRRLLAVNQSSLPSTQPKPRNSGKGKKRKTSISPSTTAFMLSRLHAVVCPAHSPTGTGRGGTTPCFRWLG